MIPSWIEYKSLVSAESERAGELLDRLMGWLMGRDMDLWHDRRENQKEEV